MYGFFFLSLSLPFSSYIFFRRVSYRILVYRFIRHVCACVEMSKAKPLHMCFCCVQDTTIFFPPLKVVFVTFDFVRSSFLDRLLVLFRSSCMRRIVHRLFYLVFPVVSLIVIFVRFGRTRT